MRFYMKKLLIFIPAFIILALVMFQFFNGKTMNYQELDAEELEELLNSDNEDFVVLDVRTPKEYDEGHIPNSVMINFHDPDFREQVNQLDKDKTYYVICRSGNRSGQACNIMYDLGFKNLHNIEGGMLRYPGDVE